MERSPEILRSEHETRPEQAPDRDMCLDSLLAQAEGRPNSDFDPIADKYLIDGINAAVVDIDRARGLIRLACQMPGCMADDVIVERTSGIDGGLVLTDVGNLSDCISI